MPNPSMQQPTPPKRLPPRDPRDLSLLLARFLVGELPLAVYLVLGVVGTFWVSDDFDDQRLAAMACVGLPGVVLFYASRWLIPGWRERWPRAHAAVVAVLVLLATTGTVPLINAVTAPVKVVKRTVHQGTGVAVRDERRGGLGLLFRVRF